MTNPRFLYPSLTPTYSLGSYGRTRGALLISSRVGAKRASAGRIYAFEQRKGQGQAYKEYLLKVLGPGYVYKNAWSAF